MTSETKTEQRFSETQLKIFRDRYALRNPDHPEELLEDSPVQMWQRVAQWATQNEEKKQHWTDQFHWLLEDFKFVPGGRILHAAGSTAKVTSSNCYVLPNPEDSREGIMQSLSWWVETQARGGGVGINMSALRPKGTPVRGVNGTSSGPVPWMELFTTATKEVIQQGGSRRGAAMIMLNDHHPDIFEFITAKKTPGRLEGANLSVVLSDAFMAAVATDGIWILHWNGDSRREIKARELWDAITESAWESGEPGCFWADRYNNQRNCWYLPDQEVTTTNACSEQPLPDFGVCLLGTVNVFQCSAENRTFEWTLLQQIVETAVRFLDNVIDPSHYPLPQYQQHQQAIRRMGIGVTGLADALIKMGIPYGSEEGISMTENIYMSIADFAYSESVRLAEERGMFPSCDPEKHAQAALVQRLSPEIGRGIAKHGIRNGYLTSQQPSGTGSLLAGVNSGIEPVFDFQAIRKDRTGEYVPTSEATKMWIERGHRPEMVAANDLTPEQHVLVQAAAQRWLDTACSKTVNAPSSHTVEDVRRLYEYAYAQGLVTIAYYRDGSRQEQVLYHPDETPAPPLMIGTNGTKPIRLRLPATRKATNHRFQVGEQEGYFSVGLFPDGGPGELFLTVSQQGSTVRGLMDGIGVLVSLARQYGVPLEAITRKFKGMQFEPAGQTDNKEIPFSSSVLDYLGRWLEKEFGGAEEKPVRNGNGCPECGSQLIYQEGCQHCSSCDYTRC